jgi:tetratricopeptide (TPR) repeat protein
MYLSALKNDQKYGEAYYGLSQATLRLNNADEAAPALRRAIELLPDGPERDNARVQLADIYLGYLRLVTFQPQVSGDTERLAGDLLKRDPDSYHGHRIKGTIALIRLKFYGRQSQQEARKELLRGMAELRTANQIRPNQPEVVEPLIRCLELSGQGNEAEDLLRRAIDHDKTALAAYRELRGYYLAAGRKDDALRILQLAIRNNPMVSSLLLDLAHYYHGAGRLDETRKIIEGITARVQDFPAAFLIAGDFYVGVGQMEAAAYEYQGGIAAFPADKLKYQTRLVAVYRLWRRTEEARRINGEILKADPNNIDALVTRASMLFEQGDLAGSVSGFETALRMAPYSWEAHYGLGCSLVSLKQPERARIQFSQAIQWEPANAAARLALAQVEIDAGEYGKAVIEAEEALRYQPKDPAAQLIRAIGWLGMKKYDEARAGLSAILAANPKHAGALFQLGKLEAALGHTTEAAVAYRKSYEADPAHNTRSLVALANLSFARNRTDEALRVLRSEVERFPERNDLRLDLATLTEQAGRFDLAIAELEGLLPKASPGSSAAVEVRTRLSECYLKRKDFDQALTHIEAARQIQPENPMVLQDVGLVYSGLGRTKEAMRAYEACLKYDGDNGVALNNLAYLIAENGGDLDQALTLAQRARQKTPSDIGFADTLGWIYFKKNLPENAREIFEDIVRRKPDEPVFRYHLALTLARTGRADLAQKELRAALQDHPSAEDTGKITEQLARLAAAPR